MKRLGLVLAMLGLWFAGLFPAAAQSGERPIISPENAAQVEQIAVLGRGWIHQIGWSPDEAILAVTSSHGVYLYDTDDWASLPVELPGYERAVVDLAWRENRLATIDAEGYVRLWRVENRETFEEQPLVQLGFQNEEVAELYHSEERWFTRSVIVDRTGAVIVPVPVLPEDLEPEGCGDCIWNASEGRYLVEGAEYHLAGEVLTLADGTRLVFKRTYGNPLEPEVYSSTDHLDAVVYCLDTDNSSCPSGFQIDILNASTGEPISHIHTRHLTPMFDSALYPVILSPDGSLVGVGGCSAQDSHDVDNLICTRYDVQLYDTTTGREAAMLQENFINRPYTVVFSPGNQWVAAADSTLIRVWDAASGQLITTLGGYGGPVYYLAVHPGGDFVAAGHWGGITRSEVVNFWDEQSWITGQPLVSLPAGGPLAFSPDGTMLVTGNAGDFYDLAFSYAAFWDVSDPARPMQRTDIPNLDHLFVVTSLSYSQDGSRLLALTLGGDSPSLILWDTAANEVLESVSTTLPSFTAVFSSDHSLVAIVVEQWPVLFNTTQLLEAGSINDYSEAGRTTLEGAYEVAFSPDGARFATLHEDNSAHLWDTATRTEQAAPINLAAAEYGVNTLAFSPDGSLLAVGGCVEAKSGGICVRGGIWLIDVETFEVVATLEGHQERVNALAFSADGRLLYSGSGNLEYYVNKTVGTDHHLRVWGVPPK